MSKVIMFSRFFPSYHPREGAPTHFVEKIVQGLVANDVLGYDTQTLKDCRDKGILKISALDPDSIKNHTIRSGHRWKVGDWFSPRVWSGNPYNSKQIILGPDIQIKKLWDFSLRFVPEANLNLYGFINNFLIDTPTATKLAANDGLSLSDFESWFNPPKKQFKSLTIFSGQIICWNQSVDY